MLFRSGARIRFCNRPGTAFNRRESALRNLRHSGTWIRQMILSILRARNNGPTYSQHKPFIQVAMNTENTTCCSPEDNCCATDDKCTTESQADTVRNNVRNAYSKVAEANNNGYGCGVASSCCGVSDDADITTRIST